MDRLNHVKIATPDPDAVDRFLREILDIPQGWTLGERPADAPPPAPVQSTIRDADGQFTQAAVMDFRAGGAGAGAGAGGGMQGYITGSPESRQFQILYSPKPHVWAVAVGTRNLERAHQRCQDEGIAVTDVGLTVWGEGGIRFFFAEVGGIVFEVLRVEEKPQA